MNNIITLIEPAGRTIIAELVTQDSQYIEVKNPVILHAQPDNTGRLNIQTFPLFFRELVSPDAQSKRDTKWKYPRNSTVIGSVELDEKLKQAYINLNNPQPIPQSNTAPKTVKLFDDEQK